MEIYFAFYKGRGTLTDWLVRRACSIRHGERVFYSHVEILRDKPRWEIGNPLLAQDCIAASKRDGTQVRQKRISFKDDHWDIVSIPSKIALFETAQEFLGVPYDLLGAALCVTPLARQGRDAWFCSEMVASLMLWDKAWTYDPHMIAKRMMSLPGAKIHFG